MTDITTGSPGAAIETSTASAKDLPAWYQQYTQMLGQQGANLASNLNSQPLPEQSVVGFNGDQTDAFGMVRNNIGNWQQPLQQATTQAGQIAGAAAPMIDYAQGAVGGPSANWTDNWQQYMSPYTSAVTDNIARLGERQWNQSIMPGINASMIGNGQFGSTRNADVLGQAGNQAANDILGQQSTALQAGYGTAAGIFANDANRQQQQQQMQANTALTGAQDLTNSLSTGANTLGALSKSWQTQGNTDAQSLLNIGNQQQGLDQASYDTWYKNQMAARTDPWTQLQNAGNLVTGVQLPSTQTQTNSAPASAYGPGALSTGLSAYYLAMGLNANGTPKTATGA